MRYVGLTLVSALVGSIVTAETVLESKRPIARVGTASFVAAVSAVRPQTRPFEQTTKRRNYAQNVGCGIEVRYV